MNVRGRRARPQRALGLSQAFSILEVMIVLVIIGLILGMVGPQLFKQLDKAKVQSAEAQIKLLRTSLETFNLDMQRYPTTTEGLAALTTPPTGTNSHLWAGPYLQDQLPVDPLGNAYVYRLGDSRDRPFYLYSWGADGKEGGDGFDKDVGILPPATKR